MEKIYSKLDPAKLLHCIYRKEDLLHQQERGLSISPEEMALQARTIAAKKGEVFAAHKHPLQERSTTQTQESLVIIKGAVKTTYYDTDDSVIHEEVLRDGDCTVTFAGGHKYEILEPTFMYEHKNGPYTGYERDKQMIGRPHA